MSFPAEITTGNRVGIPTEVMKALQLKQGDILKIEVIKIPISKEA